MQRLEDTFTCPVCGYLGLHRPAYSPSLGRRGPSGQICPSCWFEYGRTDLDLGYTHEEWRSLWIADGMPWRSPVDDVPPGWDPQVQLGRVKP